MPSLGLIFHHFQFAGPIIPNIDIAISNFVFLFFLFLAIFRQNVPARASGARFNALRCIVAEISPFTSPSEAKEHSVHRNKTQGLANLQGPAAFYFAAINAVSVWYKMR